jgi:DNA-binding response OmpR family regulator
MSGGGLGDATDYLRMARNVGANQLLTKPFRLAELLAYVERLTTRPV